MKTISAFEMQKFRVIVSQRGTWHMLAHTLSHLFIFWISNKPYFVISES